MRCNSFGLDLKDGPLMVVLIFASRQSRTEDRTMEKAGLAFVERIDRLAQRQGMASSYKLLTYAFPGQDVISGYGQESKEHVEALSKKYDPQGFFRKVANGAFKLFGQGRKVGQQSDLAGCGLLDASYH
ncbi:MAG: hypothetical protein M1831_000460 [Alyxoria varia]|nr:MAG: hypothetical protein M1831_000460 [Alyxoria varia]